ncbi:MAG TPA: phage tail protein [Pseudomonadota bacterium]|nr:phage tail protein [Pseudomonadota bacterium]
MALSKSEIKTAYPLPTYNYRVEIAGVAIGFSEVSGLSISRETTTYKESPTASGVVGPVVMNMPSQRGGASVSLKKGLVKTTSVATLYSWINSIQLNQVEKKDIYVRLCDESGNAVISWKVVNAFPKKLDAPSFSASSNDAAIESMELMADAIFIEET